MSEVVADVPASRPIPYPLIPTVLAIVVLAGWWIQDPRQVTLLPGFPPMVPATCFLIIATSAGVLSRSWGRQLGGACVLLYAGTLALERALGFDSGLIRLHPFEHDYLENLTSAARPARTTLTSFVLLGGALLLMAQPRRSRIGRLLPGALAAAVVTVAWTILLGYLVWASDRRDADYLAGIALPTGVSLLVLGLSLLQHAWREIPMPERDSAAQAWLFSAWLALAAYVIDRSLRVPVRPVSHGSELLLGGILGLGTATLVAVALLSAERARHARDVLARTNVRLREREAALARSEELLRVARDSALDAFLLLGAQRARTGEMEDFEVLDVNPRTEQLLGRTRAQMLGERLSEIIPAGFPPDLVRKYAQVVGEGVPLDEEMVVQGSHGSGTWWRHQAVRTGDGVAVTLHDVTAAREIELQFRHSQKIDAIGRLASGVAHDFNNMLAVVLGTTEELLADPGLTAPQRNDLATIRHAVERGTELTNRLLTFSRRQPSRRETLALDSLVRDVVELARRAMPPSHVITTHVGAGTTTILADRALLEQAVMNLLLNARDAMPLGGTIAVTVDAVTISSKVRHATGEVTPGEWARLEVRDAGHGMSTAIVEHIFEPFFTTKPIGQGSGLGLSTAFGIVRQADGHIVVAESGSDGTAMHLYLPVAASAVARESPHTHDDSDAAPTVSTRAERIVVVDDEPEVRQVVARLLRRMGHDVVEADSGPTGLALAAQHGATVLVTDMVMPGMGGAELGRLAMAADPALSVLYISGYTEDEMQLMSSERTRERFLPKPFTARELLDVLEELLAARDVR